MKVLKILKKITAFVSRYMAAIVILVAALALLRRRRSASLRPAM